MPVPDYHQGCAYPSDIQDYIWEFRTTTGDEPLMEFIEKSEEEANEEGADIRSPANQWTALAKNYLLLLAGPAATQSAMDQDGETRVLHEVTNSTYDLGVL